VAHDYLPGLKQWFSTKEIKKTPTAVGMVCNYIKILLCRKNIMTPVRCHFFPVIYFFIFCEGGKSVKKAIKKVASGLVRDTVKKVGFQDCQTKIKCMRYTIQIVHYCLILHYNEISRNILFQSNVQRRKIAMVMLMYHGTISLP